jgi:hypothetical protein
MPEIRIQLATTFSNAIASETWWLVATGPDDLALEGRFEDDRRAMGEPNWSGSQFCVERSEWGAVCRLPLTSPLADVPPKEYRFVVEQVWAAAKAEVEKFRRRRGDPEPETADGAK